MQTGELELAETVRLALTVTEVEAVAVQPLLVTVTV
jgi:hypothetical protein